jgi:hypothetical protein
VFPYSYIAVIKIPQRTTRREELFILAHFFFLVLDSIVSGSMVRQSITAVGTCGGNSSRGGQKAEEEKETGDQV